MDKKQCRYTDENGQVQNPSLNACAEAVSAVKAIQIAASQGQKVYTVNASNASAALAASGAGGEIKEAIQAGMEVTFHERGINAHGWSGTGYSIVDPETGVGSYLIEGKGNGGFIAGVAFGHVIGLEIALNDINLSNAKMSVGLLKGTLLPLLEALIITIASAAIVFAAYGAIYGEKVQNCFITGIGIGIAAASLEYAAFMKIANVLRGTGGLGELKSSTLTVAVIQFLGALVLSSQNSEPIGNCI